VALWTDVNGGTESDAAVLQAYNSGKLLNDLDALYFAGL
jgi:hypothetical protein